MWKLTCLTAEFWSLCPFLPQLLEAFLPADGYSVMEGPVGIPHSPSLDDWANDAVPDSGHPSACSFRTPASLQPFPYRLRGSTDLQCSGLSGFRVALGLPGCCSLEVFEEAPFCSGGWECWAPMRKVFLESPGNAAPDLGVVFSLPGAVFRLFSRDSDGLCLSVTNGFKFRKLICFF